MAKHHKQKPNRGPTAAASSEPTLLPARGSAAWLIVPVLVWVLLVHCSGLSGAFVFDDQGLLDRDSLRHFSELNWFQLRDRPITMASFALNFTLAGPDPFWCHVVNIAIHVAAVFILYLLVRRTLLLSRSALSTRTVTGIALAVALLWGVHPLTTSAVTYIVQRAESLASLAMLLSVLCWAHAFANLTEPVDQGQRVRFGWALAAIAAAWVAYGSKQMSAGLPLIIVFYDRLFLASSWRVIARRWAWYVALLAPVVVGAVLILPRLLADDASQRTVGVGVGGISSWQYFTSQPFVFARYLQLSLFPVGQTLDYGWLPSREPTRQWLGVIGWLLIVGVGIALFRSCRGMAFLWVAMLLVLAPTSTLIPLQDIIFEHRFYLPLACLLAGLVSCVALRSTRHQKVPIPMVAFRSAKDRKHAAFAERKATLRSHALAAFVFVAAVVLSLLTIARNADYRSPLRIHLADAANVPDNPRVWASVASAVEADSPAPMIESLSRAVELSDQRGFYYAGTDYKWPRDLADALFMTGRIDEARQYYEQALPHSYDKTQSVEIVFSLAMIASMQGRDEAAEYYFQQALETDSAIKPQIVAAYQAHRARRDEGAGAANR